MTSWSQPIVEQIWRDKYRHKDEEGRGDSFARVVQAVYAHDGNPQERQRALVAMFDLRWCPAGRIHAGAGTGNKVTLMNCYVAPTVQDSMETERLMVKGDEHHPGKIYSDAGILDALKVCAITQQMGGGIGTDFSTIRPRGAKVRRTGTTASGPLSFMDMWDAMCRTVMSAGHRRGAMMATLRCDHPDIIEFVRAKRTPGRLTNFNMSVLATDAFMHAVEQDLVCELKFGGAVYTELRARMLWDLIVRNNYEHAEPGVIFIDRVNALNNLRYCEQIAATNPCGEQPLPPNGACNLGAVNLAVHVRYPFTSDARVDWVKLADTVAVGVRFLDNVLDVTMHPTAEQAEEARLKRRIGLGVTGLANMLQQLRLRYGSPEAVELTATVMGEVARMAYITSGSLAASRGHFPLYDARLLDQPLFHNFPGDTREIVKKHGLRNGVLLTIAPTGTTSLYYDNVSSGIEPVFAHSYTRNVRQPDDTYKSQLVYDWGWLAFCKARGLANDLYPAGKTPDLTDHPYMVTTDELTVEEHLQMQAACQLWVDASISKTINCPAAMTFDEFKNVYTRAYELGLKGCTTYRPNPASGRGAILESVVQPGSITEVEGPVVQATNERGDDITSAILESAVMGPVSATSAPAPGKRPRADTLAGVTRKIRWPSLDHAHYVTVNFDEAGVPFEVFITSKDAQHQEWMQALSLLITSIMRKGGDVAYWVEELKQVHSAAGGHFLNKRFVPSLVAFIAQTAGELMQLRGENESTTRWSLTPAADEETRFVPIVPMIDDRKAFLEKQAAGVLNRAFARDACPKCYVGKLTRSEGCENCESCDYSRCG